MSSAVNKRRERRAIPASCLRLMKRVFDCTVATLGLIVLGPFFLLVSVLIKIDSRGPVFFKQERVGRGFRPFHIYKFRTMAQDAPQIGTSITIGDDPRITRVGRHLRRTKIDEFPQLFNVFKGEMSLVGPRPEVAEFVQLFRADYEEILQLRPGITDLASLKYSNEAAILKRAENPEKEYVEQVLPDKIRLAKEYIRCASLRFDLTVILRTLLRIFEYKVTQ